MVRYTTASRYFTTEHNKFIINNYLNFRTVDEFTKAFNNKYNLNYSSRKIRDYVSKVLLIQRPNRAQRYTAEQKEFLKQNANSYDMITLTKLFNEKFNMHVHHDTIRSRCLYHNYLTTNHNWHTPKILDWVASNKSNYTCRKELRIACNNKFNTNFTYCAFEEVCRKLHITYVHKWSKKEKEWLLKNVPNMGPKECYENFLKIFSEVTYNQLTQYIHGTLRIQYNKNKMYIEQSYKKQDPIGTTMYRKGIKYIKITNNPKHRWKNYMPYHQYVYEQAYGKIKKHEIILPLDGNYENTNLENLYCISTGLALHMKSQGYNGKGLLTKSACEVIKTLHILKTMEEK